LEILADLKQRLSNGLADDDQDNSSTDDGSELIRDLENLDSDEDDLAASSDDDKSDADLTPSVAQPSSRQRILSRLRLVLLRHLLGPKAPEAKCQASTAVREPPTHTLQGTHQTERGSSTSTLPASSGDFQMSCHLIECSAGLDCTRGARDCAAPG